MPIKIEDIVTILNSENNKDSVFEKLILDYASLKQKLSSPKEQSWYFEQALESNKKKLEDLKKHFEKIRNDVNSSTIDDLIASQKEALESNESYMKIRNPIFIRQIALGSVNSKLNYLQQLIQIKSRIKEVRELEYYLEDEKNLVELLGW
jgi:hypothetical protein